MLKPSKAYKLALGMRYDEGVFLLDRVVQVVANRFDVSICVIAWMIKVIRGFRI